MCQNEHSLKPLTAKMAKDKSITSNTWSLGEHEADCKCWERNATLTSNAWFAGDGAGVGKGRTIAGIIYENYLQGRKRSLW